MRTVSPFSAACARRLAVTTELLLAARLCYVAFFDRLRPASGVYPHRIAALCLLPALIPRSPCARNEQVEPSTNGDKASGRRKNTWIPLEFVPRTAGFDP